jgi:hypothetical protein
VRRVIVWQLTGDSPPEHRLTWSIDDTARRDLEDEVFGKRVLITGRDDWPVAEVVAAYRSRVDILRMPTWCSCRLGHRRSTPRSIACIGWDQDVLSRRYGVGTPVFRKYKPATCPSWWNAMRNWPGSRAIVNGTLTTVNSPRRKSSGSPWDW